MATKRKKRKVHSSKYKARQRSPNTKRKNRKRKMQIKKRNNLNKLLSEIKIITLAFFIIVLLISVAILLTTSFGKMNGYSMMPEINNNDIFTINKISPLTNFDIVYLKTPNTKNEKSVRRIIGLPGDEITYKNDELTINNVGKAEKYLNQRKNELLGGILTEDFTLKNLTGRLKVPKDSYFVLGDNRQSSADSRDYGFIKKNKIIGKVELVIFPLEDIKSLN